MLELAGVGRTFADGTAAVRDLDLRVRRGEFVTVVGPSGCGKSTLLRIASGLETATTGGRCTSRRRRLGYVFQDATLLPWRTVQRNVELLAELEGMGPRPSGAAGSAEAIDLVGLTGFERHRARSSSPAACGCGPRWPARSCSTRELFLFDEPFGALDEITRERLNDELLRAVRAQRFAGAVRHPLGRRGGVPVHAGSS